MATPDTDRRTVMLDHALTLFAERGLAAVSTRDLAERAGLARSHVYHYFKDWQTLRCAAFVRFAHTELQQARTTLESLPERQALEAFARGWLGSATDPSARLWIDAWVESLRDAALAAAYNAAMQDWMALLEETLRRVGLPHGAPLVQQVFALINGYALAAGLQPGNAHAVGLPDLLLGIDRLIAGASVDANAERSPRTALPRVQSRRRNNVGR
jgi:AcrR family transcriptional regulator